MLIRSHRLALGFLIGLTSSGPTAANLSIYSASVNPPDSPYSYLLSGNTIFDTVFATFNTTGVLAIGGILLAAGFIFALRAAPDDEIYSDQLENVKMEFKKQPLPNKNFYEIPTTTAMPTLPSFSASPLYKAPESGFESNQAIQSVIYKLDLNDRLAEADEFVGKLVEPTSLGAELGPYPYKTARRRMQFYLGYPATPLAQSTSQIFEPVFENDLDIQDESDSNLLVGSLPTTIQGIGLDPDAPIDVASAYSFNNPVAHKRRYFIPLNTKKFKPSRRQYGSQFQLRSPGEDKPYSSKYSFQ